MRVFLNCHLFTVVFLIVSIVSVLLFISYDVRQGNEVFSSEIFSSIVLTAPAFIAGLFSSFHIGRLLNINNMNTKFSFKFDFVVVLWTSTLSLFIYGIINVHNIDVLGWWPYMFFIGSIESLLLALLYSVICILIKRNHRLYTFLFGIVLLVGFILSSFNIFSLNWVLYLFALHIVYGFFCFIKYNI